MRFWLAARLECSGQPPITTDSRQYQSDLIKRGYRMIGFPQLDLPNVGNGIKVKGHYETKDRSEVVGMMKVGGNLRCNPQDAIDEGILTYAEVKGLGFDNVTAPAGEPEVKATAPKVEPPDEALPDFNILSKARLVAWADAQDPPIHLDRRKRKDALQEDLKAALEKRKQE